MFNDLALSTHHFIKNGAIPHFDSLLLQVTNLGTFGENDTPGIRRILAGDNVEHGGLAGAVGPNKRNPIVLFKTKGHVLEENTHPK